jgi:1,2-diacylglycerol 3-alpha-glucosyltransferase
MRIAYFTDTYHPQINGVVQAISDFEVELKKRGHEIFIFYPKTKGGISDRYHIPVPSFTFPKYKEYRAPLMTLRLISRTRKINPDIIHVQTPASIGFGGMLVAKALEKPLVMHYHTLMPEYFSYFLGRFYKLESVKSVSQRLIWKYTKFLYNKADLILVPSQSIKELLLKHGIRKEIIVLPNPVKLSAHKKLSHKGINILHVGRLCKEKSIDVVLRAFKKIEQPGINLIITSDGPDRKRLENLAKNLKIKNIKFTGYLPRHELDKIYATSDIFVSASRTETFGLVFIEAFKFGVPVVCFPALGAKDVVQDGLNGLFARTADEMAEKIKTLIEDKNMRAKLSHGAKKSVPQYSVEKITKDLEKIYSSLLK